MDLYRKKSNWKWYLAIAGLVIVVVSAIYTNKVASQIAEQEAKRAEQWASAVAEVTKSLEDTACADLNLEFISSIIIDNEDIPVIITNDLGTIISHKNLNEAKALDTAYLERQKAIMAATNDTIIIDTRYYKNYVFYKNSRLYTILTYFPVFQLLLIGGFLLVGYIGFSAARKAEQNQVWVGMAKETAHQLGTPISGLVAWIEYLKADAEGDESKLEVVKELEKDVSRLSLVAERFSKIGAIPELKEMNIVRNLHKNATYMQTRAPKRVSINAPSPHELNLSVKINPSLFDWVMENLIRNALDALEGKGEINISAFEDEDYIYVDVKDTGKGIPSNKHKTVFKPGYSTKKRGWGLGLSLTQRIIKNYHNGKIFVKESEIGKGTTFRIQLPKK